jgi:hypothetical protein
MIAFFMLSSTFVFADGPEAGITDVKEPKQLAQYEALRKVTDPISQQPCPVWIVDLVSIDLGPDNNIFGMNLVVDLQLLKFLLIFTEKLKVNM